MEDSTMQFEGISEIDEVYIGGRTKMQNKMSNKTVVVGIINRDKKEVVAKKVESAKTYDLQPTIYENVKECSILSLMNGEHIMFSNGIINTIK